MLKIAYAVALVWPHSYENACYIYPLSFARSPVWPYAKIRRK